MAELDLAKLKVKLHLKDPFLGCIAMQVKWKETKTGTASTTGGTIYYSPSFFEDYDTAEQVAIIAHECMHIALQHTTRAETFNLEDRQLYNICADYVINYELSKMGFRMPPCGLHCPDEYKGMSTEQIYHALKEKDLSPNLLQAIMETAVTPEDLDPDPNEQNQVRKILNVAHNTHTWDTSNGEFSREFQRLMHPKLPWWKILRNYVNEFIKDNYSWSRPSKRFDDIYMPSVVDEEIFRNAAVYIDVSGSVSEDLVSKFVSETKKMHKDFELSHLRIAYFSVEINQVTDMYDSWVQPESCDTGGGTVIDPVYKDINQLHPTVAIIFTDGYFEAPQIKCKYPIIWCIYDNNDFKPEKGKVIYVDGD